MECTMGALSDRQRKKNFQMEKRQRLGLPRYTLGEEIFSSVSHGVSALFAVAALVFLLLMLEEGEIKELLSPLRDEIEKAEGREVA